MQMQKIIVGLGERSYPIWLDVAGMNQLGTALDLIKFPRKVALVTNPEVGRLFGQTVVDVLNASGREVTVIQVPDGEQYKSLETLSDIYDALIDRHFDRYSGMIALGGGVIGDLTGFAAATYLRGIPFVQIPTTLLAQVDSSVGGKTGVNHPQGKNLIGAFYQPRHVHIDISVLESLPWREYAAGMAEVIKYGIIRDAEFFDWLVENSAGLRARNSQVLLYAVMKSCQIKADVVENDEKEQGLRAILNLGHTFGHAVETLAGYGVVKHGEAVSIGMVLAAQTACRMGLCDAAQVGRIRALLAAFDLPVTPPDFTAEEYLGIMQLDKKVKDGTVRLVLNKGIGDADMYDIESPITLLEDLLTSNKTEDHGPD